MSDRISFFAGQRTWAAHSAEYLALIDGVLATGQSLQGPATGIFEEALARKTSRRHAIAVGSGTDALAFALAAADVGPGDEVLVPAVSFIATASAIVRLGAVPVFVDVDAQVLLDLGHAARLVTDRTRAVLPVQLFGQMLDPAALSAFAAAHGLAVVEDAAQALGATAGGAAAGSVGELSCCSFDPTKTVAAPGSGGAVLCDDDDLAEHVRRLRWHGRGADGLHGELGFNSQLPTASAAILTRKLQQDVGWIARRREIAAAYDAALASTAHRPVGPAPGRDHVFHKYVVRSPERDRLRARLADQEIPTLIHYPRPLPSQPLFGDAARGGPWPHAEAFCRETLSLPIHAFLTDAEVDRVCSALCR